VKECAACGNGHIQRAHVKDRAILKEAGKQHDFFNIVHLCAHCHFRYFDKGLMAILLQEQKFLILRSLSPRLVEEVTSREKLALKPEYVDWKNGNCHNYLHAEIRKRKLGTT
jgi:hypothetical protein